MKTCCNFLKTALIIFIFLPIFAHGQIVITEIMYDLAEGSDTGREWVEIFNSGNAQVDLAGWKFNDGDGVTNHILNEPPKNGGRGSLILKSNEYAVLSGDANLFIPENLSYTGTVIDTVMSLKNISGEILILDKENNQIDKVLYNKEMGGAGDGNTLQKTNSGWKAGNPTLGSSEITSVPSSTPPSPSGQATTTVTNNSQTTQQQNFTSPAFDPQIFAYAGEDRTVIVGADTIFDAKAIGLNDEPIENALFTWNFGDGSFQKGKKIMHSYNYPGKYVVFLEASSGEYSVTDRINVTALPADIVISNVGRDADKNFIELYNRTNRELNLSWWRLQADNNFFTLQKNTVILPNEKIIFPKSVTNLNITNQSKISLLYPNGSLATSFGESVTKVFLNGTVAKSNDLTEVLKASNYAINKEISDTQEAQNEVKNTESMDSLATVVNSDLAPKTAQNGDVFKWLVGLSSMVLLSIIGFIFVKKEPILPYDKEKDEIQKISNEIEIF
ncbi:MAG: endonuclease i [Parcubacteria group bacterium Athens0714_16]|nr:MAG: endonuclease i [Parcubacteria group bacterium Athens0714_16]